MSPLFLDIMSSYFLHSSSKACWVFGEMFLSLSKTFLCTGTSARDFWKSSSFCMNGFSKNSFSFSWHFLSGIQFLGRSFSNCSMVQISNTSPSLQSFSVKPLHGLLGDVNVHGGWSLLWQTVSQHLALCPSDLLSWGMCICWDLHLTKAGLGWSLLWFPLWCWCLHPIL